MKPFGPASGWIPLATAVVYLLVPGHPGVLLSGIPVGLYGAAAMTALIMAMWWWRRAEPPSSHVTTATLILATCVIGKVAIGLVATAEGWTGRYYANDRFAGEPERSTDFLGLDATRLDRVLDFEGDSFPAYFLNHLRLESPAGRSQLVVEQPLSIAWTGYLHVDSVESGGFSAGEPSQRSVTLTAAGDAWLLVDGAEKIRVASGDSARTVVLDLASGLRRVEVFYVKPANSPGRLHLDGLSDVFPEEVTGDRLRLSSGLRYASWLIHAVAGFVLASYIRVLVRMQRSVLTRLNRERWLYLGILVLFGAQGLLHGARHMGRVWDLTSGDDWFGFEARARDVLIGGPLMTLGAPIGQGEPFFFYPLYSYFAAGVHWLVGEDGSGIVFVQFVILGLTAIVVHRLARELFNEPTATVAAIFLIGIEQLAFARYYTITMLADNLYILPVALAVYFLTRFAATSRVQSLIAAGAWVGVAALTKPAMLAFLGFSIPYVGWLEYARTRGASRALGRAVTYLCAALALISVATLRNVIVARDPVLITAGQGPTFIHYALPPELIARERYATAPASGLVDSVAAVMRMALRHPVEYVQWNSRKVAFSLGLVHLQTGYRPHPELLVAALGYLASLVIVPAARSRLAWPCHLFVISHLATMVLTLPWVYGYRLILPPFVLAPIFASAAGVTAWTRWRDRVKPRQAVPGGAG